ncbi:cation:dicarboxylate symporter family transporter [Priestia endophytica]|jgi:proton glutamate symport protein|uniref:Glutamate:protein symporter n=2 Tax=Priestia endophytica TaxID=135735 RepID=A0AAX1Q651_9BACI|nr:cation:dicarboxylase symporter family transporter [Priestia endophytica]KAB2495357.1 cation:dicarboxylase symporter family transporter [Priestia endophytica]KYG27998.1 glutamate:protein symporter [Priestia endophytica]MBG9813984.1 glutamate:protein symporter [Priestia endophytica]MCM3537592.1 cation:dicarboxylase symporter family transporter [Priestia endophytica]RAS72672.1 glutamate:protein symporter [Priestia endophytica]
MKKFGLATQIFVGLALGIAVGAIFYGNETAMAILQPIGDIFLNLVKMIVIPIVVSALVVSIAGVGDIKKLGKLGGKTLLYFEIVTTIALLIGLLAANLFHPGTGIEMGNLEKSNISSYEETAQTEEKGSIADQFVHIIPSNIVQSLAEGDLLAIVFFSVLLGLGVAAVGEKGKPVLSFFEGLLEAMFWITNLVMKFAPFGVFALIGVNVAKFGIGSLIPLGKLILVIYLTMFFFVFVVLGIIAKMAGVNIFVIIKILKEELILAFTTASSEAVLPKLIDKMEKFGCPKAVTSFVIPTGYTFNLDGSSIYQAIAAIFIAQMYGIHLSIGEQITLLLVLMLTSKGMAGVAGASFVVVITTLGSMGLPLEGMAFIAGIDRILDMLRTSVNVVGNALASIVMSRWEGSFDKQKAAEYTASLKKSNAA